MIKNEMRALVGGCTSEGTKVLALEELKEGMKEFLKESKNFLLKESDESNN